MVSRTQGIKSYHCPRVLDDYQGVASTQTEVYSCIGTVHVYALPPSPPPPQCEERSHLFSHAKPPP